MSKHTTTLPTATVVNLLDTFDQVADATTLYRHWGAHLLDGGVRFAVWAPNAREVSVITDSNGWTAGHDWLVSGYDSACDMASASF